MSTNTLNPGLLLYPPIPFSSSLFFPIIPLSRFIFKYINYGFFSDFFQICLFNFYYLVGNIQHFFTMDRNFKDMVSTTEASVVPNVPTRVPGKCDNVYSFLLPFSTLLFLLLFPHLRLLLSILLFLLLFLLLSSLSSSLFLFLL